MHLLDRLLLQRCLLACGLVLAVITVLVVGIDLTLRAERLLSGGGGWSDLLILALVQAPQVALPIIPAAAIGGALITCAPMLRRREFIALVASGIALRRACCGALAAAGLIGVLAIACADRVVPTLEPTRAALTDELRNRRQPGRVWRDPVSDTLWSCASLDLRHDTLPVISPVMAAGPEGMVIAEALEHDGERWLLRGPVYRWWQEGGEERQEQLDHLVASGWLAIADSPQELAARLVSRHALNAATLLARGDPADARIAWSRLAHLALPFLAVLAALPIFVRFENRDQLLMAAVRSVLVGLLPILIEAAVRGGADQLDWPPLLAASSGLAAAAVPGAVLWWRWRL